MTVLRPSDGIYCPISENFYARTNMLSDPYFPSSLVRRKEGQADEELFFSLSVQLAQRHCITEGDGGRIGFDIVVYSLPRIHARHLPPVYTSNLLPPDCPVLALSSPCINLTPSLIQLLTTVNVVM